MANNDVRLDDLVDIKSVKKQFDTITDGYKLIGEEYANLTVALAKKIGENPSGLDGLADKQKKCNDGLKELIATQNKLSDLQKEYDKLLKSVAEQTKKNVQQILEEAKANDLNAAAELNLSKAKTEQLKQEKLLNQTKKQTKVTIEEAIALTKTEVKTEREATEQNRLLRAAKKDVDVTTKEGQQVIERMNASIDKNTALIRKNSDGLVKQKMTVGDYKNQVKQALNEMSRGENVAKNLGVALKSGAAAGFTEVSIGVGSMIKGMIGAQAIIGLFQKAIGLIKSGIDSIINFEAANSKLSAVLGVTSSGMKELIADAKRLGAATKYTASEATNLQIELAKLGFTKKEILESTESILKFAQATGAELPEAAALAGASIRMFGASTKETERYVSAMAVATVKSALSFSYLQTAMPIVGPVAKSFNFQIEDTLALLGKLSDAGFDASMAATATRNILLNLADGNGKLAKALGKPVKTLPELVNGLNKLKAEGIDLNKTLELTDKRSVAAFNAFITAANGIVPLREQITGVTGELGEMADKMGDNVAGALLGLSSAWEAFMLSFSNSTGPAKEFLDWLAIKIRGIASDLKSPKEKVEKIEYDIRAIAKKDANSKVLTAEKEFDAEYKKLRDAGESEEQARTKALEQLSNKRIEITAQEYAEIAKQKKGAQYSTFEFENMSKFKNGAAVMFGVYTKEAEKADKAQLAFSKSLFSLVSSEEFNSGIDTIIGKYRKPDKATNTNNTKELTDEEKKELEKQKAEAEKSAKERLRIREAYQQSELDLMDEGLNKEIAKISLNYSKKMAAVKGNSDEEIRTRENLAKEMQSVIEDKATSYVIAKEQKDVANKLEAVKKGSKEELDFKIEQLELQRDVEMREAINTGEDLALIDEKYNAKRKELDEKFANEQNKKLQEGYVAQSIMSNQSMQNELSALTDEYTNGIISKENYEKEKLRITEKYAIEQAQAAIDLAKVQLMTDSLSPEDRLSMESKLAEAEIALAEKVRDAQVKAAEDTANAHEEKMKKIAEGLQMAGDILNSFAELGSAIYERKIEEVEGEQDANQEAGDAEIERITHLEETGVITKEEAEARKRAAEQRTAEKDKELAKKKADLQTRQAKMEKANSITQTIISTSVAAIAAWKNPLSAPFLLPLIIAQGAISLAAIIAQPIPKYAKGTDNHLGGLAVVGDGGREEMIVSGGKSWITPSVPTLVDIPKGAVVLPDVMNMESIRGMRSDAMLLLNEKARKGEPMTVNVNNDYKKLEGGIDRLNSSFEKMAKYQRKAAVQADLRNIASRL